MASAKPRNRLATKPRALPEDADEPQKPAPLIPDSKKYIYRPSPMNTVIRNIVKDAADMRVRIDVPKSQYATVQLVHTLCSAAQANVWTPECERALVETLPIREHNKAFLSHNLFVTMIGTVVARALQQATGQCKDTLDLLADRYYVRSIACHDSTKTSKVEAAAYSGIMAVHMEKEALKANEKKRVKANTRYRCEQTEEEVKSCAFDNLYSDTDALTSAMANFGFKHHYENNPHHPEYFPEGEMEDINLVEAIVDGLACIFERNKDHTNVHSWLNMYYIDRFKGRNRALAQEIINALSIYITAVDYKALQGFKRSIFSLMGESIPWSRVTMTDCCDLKKMDLADDDVARRPDFRKCFQ